MFRFFRESVLCVLPGLVRPDRALRVVAENGLNHFDLAVPDLEHVHIGQPPPLKFTKPAVMPASTSVTGKRRCVCVMLKPLGEQLCVDVVDSTVFFAEVPSKDLRSSELRRIHFPRVCDEFRQFQTGRRCMMASKKWQKWELNAGSIPKVAPTGVEWINRIKEMAKHS
jgi:hypothetical protein